MGAIEQSVRHSRFDLAITLFQRYEPIVTVQSQKLIGAVVASVEDSTSLIEYKIFFIKKLYRQMSNNDQDRVLNAIHHVLLNEDNKHQFEASNLNPLRNSMQLIDTLEQMSKINPRNSEKTINAVKVLNSLMMDYLC